MARRRSRKAPQRFHPTPEELARSRGAEMPPGEMPGTLPARGGIPAPENRDAEWWNAHTSLRDVWENRIDGPGWVSYTRHDRVRVCPPGVAEGVETPTLAVRDGGIPQHVTLGGWTPSGNWEVGELAYSVYPSRPDDVGIFTHTRRAWGPPPSRGRDFRRVAKTLRRRMRHEGFHYVWKPLRGQYEVKVTPSGEIRVPLGTWEKRPGAGRKAIRAAWAKARKAFERGEWHTADAEGLKPLGMRWDVATGRYTPIPGWKAPDVGPVESPPVGRYWHWDHTRRAWVKPYTLKRGPRDHAPVLLIRSPKGLRVEPDVGKEPLTNQGCLPGRSITSPAIGCML